MSDEPSGGSAIPAGRPVIMVSVADLAPSGIEEGLEAELGAPGLPMAFSRRPLGPFAGLELYLPSAVMLFIAAGYFNGFLAKLGEDHYDKLKGVAARLFRRSTAMRVEAVGTPGKLSSSGFSLAYSVTGEITPKLRFKLVLRTDVEAGDAEQGIEAFLDLIRVMHAGTLDDATRERLLEHKPVGGTALVTFDAETRTIVTVAPIPRRASPPTDG